MLIVFHVPRLTKHHFEGPMERKIFHSYGRLLHMGSYFSVTYFDSRKYFLIHSMKWRKLKFRSWFLTSSLCSTLECRSVPLMAGLCHFCNTLESATKKHSSSPTCFFSTYPKPENEWSHSEGALLLLSHRLEKDIKTVGENALRETSHYIFR